MSSVGRAVAAVQRLEGDLERGAAQWMKIILATCRAHGQDEEPWHILMAWEASLLSP